MPSGLSEVLSACDKCSCGIIFVVDWSSQVIAACLIWYTTASSCKLLVPLPDVL